MLTLCLNSVRFHHIFFKVKQTKYHHEQELALRAITVKEYTDRTNKGSFISAARSAVLLSVPSIGLSHISQGDLLSHYMEHRLQL